MSDALKERLERSIIEEFSRGDFLDEMSLYHLETGGKRIRGLMALDEAAELGVPLEQALPWAAACEVLHNATLVHDDIQDNDPLRRGRPSLWKKYGLQQAINVGDYLLAKAFGLIATCTAGHHVGQLLACFSCCTERLVRGQSMEMLVYQQPVEEIWKCYLEVATGKTGALLQAPIEGIHILAGKSPEITKEWLKVGLVYQINDDLNDYHGMKQENQSLKDFEGKTVNAIVAHLSLHQEAQAEVRAYLESDPNSTAHKAVVDSLCAKIDELGVPETLRRYASGLYTEFDTAIKSRAKERVAGYFESTNIAGLPRG